MTTDPPPDRDAALVRLLEEQRLALQRANDALAEREARLRAIFDAEPECVKLLDAGGRLIDMNRAGLRMLEAESLGQVLAADVSAFVVEEHRTAFRELVERVFRGETGHLEFQITSLGGRRRWMDTRAAPLRDATGRVTALLAITRDVTERRQTEDALRESESRNRAIAELVSDYAYTFRVTPDGRLEGEWVTDSFTRAFGLTLAQVSARGGWQRMVHPDDLPEALRHVQKVVAGESDICEMRWLTVTGEVRWLRDYARPVIDERTGRVVRIHGAAQDITERKLAEARLARLNRTYALLSEINQLIVREQETQRLLAGACRIAVETGGFLLACVVRPTAEDGRLGLAAHAAATPEAAIAPDHGFDDPALGFALTERAFATGARTVCNDIGTDPAAAPWRAAALGRGYRAMAAFPLVVAGRRAGVFSLYAATAGFFDTEELKLLDELAVDLGFALERHELERERERAERELRASEVRFRELAETIDDVFWVADPDRRHVLYVSPGYEKIWGRSCQSLYEDPDSWLAAVHPDDRERVREAAVLDRVARGLYDEEYRVVRPDGQVRWIRDRAYAVRNEAGQVERVLGVARDVTESRALEAQLRQAQKMEAIGQLAGGVAHDFNNILAAILMQADLAATAEGVSEAVRADLMSIRAAAERAGKLTHQLLLFSRRASLQPQDIDLNEVVTSLARMLQRIIGEDVRVQLHLDSRPLMTHADPGMLDQILMNLAINARDAMPEGGDLRIETAECLVGEAEAHRQPAARPGRYVRLSVIDTGTGIPAHVLPHIFEPFFTTKPPGRGTGLGLATVFGIVQQHRGWIDVDSTPGRGTRFDVLLPACEARQRPTEAARPKPRGGSETILLVEDDAQVRTLARMVLERSGYRVLEAPGGHDALRIWERREGPIHLLLTDVVMPGGIDGVELAGSLRQHDPALKVLYCSGYAPQASPRQVALRSGDELLHKPFSPDQLLEAVRRCLDRPAPPLI